MLKLFLKIVFLVSLHTNIVQAASGDQILYQDFYSLKEAIANEPFDSQISRLDSFLHKNPDFDRVYLALFEKYAIEGELGKAKTYFDSIKETVNSRYCHWALAKIYATEVNLQKAYNFYLEALAGGPPPDFLLINEFVDFAYEHSDTFPHYFEDLRKKLNSWRFRAAEVSANMRKAEFDSALVVLSQIRAEFPQDLLLIFLEVVILQKIEKYKQAIRLCGNGLEDSRRQSDKKYEVLLLIEYGVLAQTFRQVGEAQKKYHQANEIAGAIADQHLIEKATGHLAGLLIKESPEDALELYKKAQQIAKKIGAPNDLAKWQVGVVQSLNTLGRYNEALQALDDAWLYAKNVKNHELLFMILVERANFFSSLGINNLATVEYRKAMAIVKNKGIARAKDAYNLFISLLINEGNSRQARTTLEDSELHKSIREHATATDTAFWKWAFAETYHLDEHYDTAHSMFLEAFAASDNLPSSQYADYLKAYSLLRIAEIELHQGNISKAIQIFNEDVVKQAAEDVEEIKVTLNVGLGKAYYADHKLEKAIEYYTVAINLIEVTRQDLQAEQLRIGYFGTASDIYKQLINTYLKRFESTQDFSDLEKIFHNLEMSRARALLDLSLKNDLAVERHPPYNRARESLRNIQRQLRFNPQLYDSLYPKYETARYNLLNKQLQAVKNRIESTHDVPSLSEMLTSLKGSDLKLLYYHISEQVSFVFFANSETVKIIKLQNDSHLAADIDSLLSPFHYELGKSIAEIPFRADLAHRLYKRLFQPVQESGLLHEGDRIVIVPDRPLMGLPLEVLLVNPAPKEKYFPDDEPSYHADFLLNRFSFIYSPSAWLATKPFTEPAPDPQILVLANPSSVNTSAASPYLLVNVRESWRSDILWFADNEADSIQSIYPETKVYKRKAATKEVLKTDSPNYQILHFATHAFVDMDFDAFSGLVLATTKASTDDGLFMGYEISDLDLNCELVTLSACETGRGRIVAGEGVLGLPRKFIGAGAKSVLMTLWKVDDEFSSQLMPRFYDCYLNEGLSRQDALSKAKRKFLSHSKSNGVHYQHPFFWAAFTLYGQPGVERQTSLLFSRKAIAIWMITIMAIGILFRVYFKRRGAQ